MALPKLYTLKETAALLRLSYKTTGRLVRTGEIKGVQLVPNGGKWLVSENAIRRFLRTLEELPPQQKKPTAKPVDWTKHIYK